MGASWGHHGHSYIRGLSPATWALCFCRGWGEGAPPHASKDNIHPRGVRELIWIVGKKKCSCINVREFQQILRCICSIQPVESKTRTYHGRVGAAHGGAAGPGRAGQDGTPTDWFAQVTTDPRSPQASWTTVLNDSSEARTTEFLCKPMEERQPRSTSGLSAGPRALFVPGCWPVCRRFFVFVNPFHARHVREKPDTPGARSRFAWRYHYFCFWLHPDKDIWFGRPCGIKQFLDMPFIKAVGPLPRRSAARGKERPSGRSR